MITAPSQYTPIVRNGLVAVATGYCTLWGVHTHPDGSDIDRPIMSVRATMPYRVLIQHDAARLLVMGSFVDIYPDPTGLRIEATLPDTPLGHFALDGIRSGAFVGWSLGQQETEQRNGMVRFVAGEVSLADRPRKKTTLILAWQPLSEWVAEKPSQRRRRT